MITFVAQEPGKPHPGHFVRVINSIGSFHKSDAAIHVRISPMEGRAYEPGKNPDGTWKDKIGKKDDRFMVYDATSYAVGTKDQLDLSFEEIIYE